VEARKVRAQAKALGDAIAEEGDRTVFLTELERGPWFGVA
jgi:hypothetical protein